MLLPMCGKPFSAWTAVCAVTVMVASSSIDRGARAQVVQLPSTHAFGYSGSVTVPDSGQANLGGVGRQRTGVARAGGGPLAGRAGGSASGGTSVVASASIIDLQAMDAAILNAPSSNQASNYTTRNAGATIINTLTPSLYARRMGADQLPPPDDPNAWQIALGGGSVSKVGPSNTIVRDDTDVRYFMHRAKQASDVGRQSAALVYYRMAYERLTPEQRERLHEFQAKASAAAQDGQSTATQAAAAAAATTPAASPPAAIGSDPASDEAGTLPASEESGNPFDSPF